MSRIVEEIQIKIRDAVHLGLVVPDAPKRTGDQSAQDGQPAAKVPKVNPKGTKTLTDTSKTTLPSVVACNSCGRDLCTCTGECFWLTSKHPGVNKTNTPWIESTAANAYIGAIKDPKAGTTFIAVPPVLPASLKLSSFDDKAWTALVQFQLLKVVANVEQVIEYESETTTEW